MKNVYTMLFIFLFSILTLAQSVSYKPGSGVKIYNEEEEWSLRLLGYIQSTYTLHNENENNSPSSSFFVRRARLDLIFDYLKDYQIFFELDARGSRTEMVLAQFDVRYYKTHKLRIGKYITPFSPENYRSSRGLSTVERYSGLNSMFLLPALDTQYGIMFFGTFDNLEYYISIANGNGKASQNLKEDNNAKDFQARLVYNATTNIKVGASFNKSTELSQSLNLADHTFENFNSVFITGGRTGFLADVEYQKDDLLLRGEIFNFSFGNGLSTSNQVDNFIGGYSELGYFVLGDGSNGLQLIGRFETARYGGGFHASLVGPKELNSYILGTNWYRNDIFRLQVNLIYESANEVSQLGGRFQGKDNSLELLTMLQLKF